LAGSTSTSPAITNGGAKDPLKGDSGRFELKTSLACFIFRFLTRPLLTRPRGKWASQPWQLVLTPTITAFFGLFVVRHTNFNALALTLIVVVSLLVIKLLKSTIALAISAGVLPMVLDERSWIYPIGIFAGLSLLALVLLVWKRYTPKNHILSSEEEIDSKVIDDLEGPHMIAIGARHCWCLYWL
jgi:hypothetical protein